MLLSEVFNMPYPWKVTEQDVDYFQAEFDVKEDNVKYAVDISESNLNVHEWNVEFSRIEMGNPHPEFDTTGTGDQQRIFATVIDIVKAFMKLPDIDPVHMLYFTAKEPSRMKLYQRLARTLLPDWKMNVDGKKIVLYHPKLFS